MKDYRSMNADQMSAELREMAELAPTPDLQECYQRAAALLGGAQGAMPVAWRISTPTGYVSDIFDNEDEAKREADGYWRGAVEPLYPHPLAQTEGPVAQAAKLDLPDDAYGFVVVNKHAEPAYFTPRDKAKAEKAFLDYGSALIPVYRKRSPLPEGDRSPWHSVEDEQPKVGSRFACLWNDGSGSIMYWRHDHGYIDQDGDEITEIDWCKIDRWAYLPSDFSLWCETRAEDPMSLPSTMSRSPSSDQGDAA